MPTGSIDQIIENVFGPVATVLSNIVFFAPKIGGVEIPLIVVWLMIGAIFLTVWLRFQPITGLIHSLHVIRGRFTRKTDPGEVSSFQALATELSGTVGLGNIAGVAVAISVGGPGAALWIIIFGFFAMSMKMAEATLGVKYREVDEDGRTAGGPMYYLKNGLAEIGRKRTGAVLAGLYAVFTLVGVFGAGNLFQGNQAATIIADQTGSTFLIDNRWIIGVVMAVFAAVVILGGITSIAKWTSKITPLMAVVYIGCVLAVLVANISHLPHAVVTIFTGALTADGVAGGAIGVAVVGIQRALFSNAAGVGTAGMAHSAVKTKDPATEGFTAMWEPLVDSIIVCTLTALAITVTGAYQGGGAGSDGIAMTSAAFGTVASWFPIVLTVAVALFAFSTVLSYAYYGQLAAAYLFGRGRVVEKVFQICWIVAVVVGAAISLDSVIAFSDAMFFLMTIPNLIGLYALSKILRLEILRHRKRVEVGTIEQVPSELAVGMGDHEPTDAQVRAAEREEREFADHVDEVKAALEADPDFPVPPAGDDVADGASVRDGRAKEGQAHEDLAQESPVKDN
ncbi:alanine/glycine:cation symporter family protein [Devriesea agamarum]|uniref:alanine/glycine:cation symporter family protein n=1 Tax=Devriesea agamarum TaxID=472569 RepID=UPI000A02B4D5|nr:amino acid carrier protein [Devriesea agamarum]